MKPSCILLSLLLLCATRASGQDIKVIQGATLFDGTGRAPLKDAIIVIEGSRIKQVVTKANIAYSKERLPTLRANLRKVHAAGIPVVLGSDSSGAFVGLASQIELLLQVESGLTPQQAIQTATINAARMINREKDLGSIEEGKLADLLILDADPLVDISNIRKIHRIIKGGVVFEQAQLLPKSN